MLSNTPKSRYQSPLASVIEAIRNNAQSLNPLQTGLVEVVDAIRNNNASVTSYGLILVPAIVMTLPSNYVPQPQHTTKRT